MLEAAVETYFCHRVLAAGGRTYKLKFLGVAGAPDRLALLPRHGAFFVELKRPAGGVLSPRQIKRHREFLELGIKVHVL